MIKTYTYKIKTNKQFEEKFNQWVGICRFVYNCALECKITAYKRQGISLSNYDLQKQLTEAKRNIPWLYVVANSTLQAICDRLDRTYQSFFRRKQGFPKFASKKKWHSIPFKTQATHFKNGNFYLYKWGTVKVFKDRLPIVGEKTKIAEIIKKADGFYLHVQVEVPYENTNENQVGIDLGISKFCVTSDGKIIENPKLLQKYEKQLRIENRSLSRKKKGSNSWRKQANKLARLHLKLSRTRTDFLQKESTNIAKQYGTVFMEDLNVKGMIQSNLSKSISDASWSTFKNLLSYKSNIVLVDSKYTSQTCSNCGHIDKDNRISQSEFKCLSCGHEENADLNASKNILSRGTALIRQREALACA